MSMEKYSEAVDCYTHSTDLYEDYEPAWTRKGLALSKAGEYSESVQCYVHALDLNPNNKIAWMRKGDSLSEIHNYSEALECYNKCLELDRTDTQIWIRKGKLELRSDIYGALHSFNEAINLDPDEEFGWIGKTKALTTLQKYSEAANAYKKALKIDQNNPIVKKDMNNLLKKIEAQKKEEK